MRQIKFRIIYKNKINGYERLTKNDSGIFWEWMALDLNPDNGKERWCRGVYPYGFEYIRNQFTGQKDVKGIEVYESDIIQYDLAAGLGQPERNGLKRVVVINHYGAFGQWDKNIRVIGNIYENSDLSLTFQSV